VGGVIQYSNLISPALAVPGQLCGGYFQATVASNNLTLAIKTNFGSDPSTSTPVYVNIGGTIVPIATATSTTKAAGFNWGAAGGSSFAAKEVDWFAYAVYVNSTKTVAISASRYPGGSLVSDFSGTLTAENHLFDHASFATSDLVAPCGRFAATLSAGGSYNWSVPTYVQGTNLIRTPTRKTRWLDWTPTIAAGYSSAPTGAVYQYQFDDRDAIITLREATPGTSNTTNVATYSLPFTALTLSNALWGANCVMTNNGTIFADGYAYISSGATIVSFTKIGGWTNSGNRQVNFTPPMRYRIG
jgi:hypothetical protein